MKEEILTLKEALAKAVDKLQQMEVPDADIDAWYLLSYVTGLDRAAFFLHGEEPMAEPDMIRYRDLVTKRGERIPLQHLTGEQEFMGLDFHVNEHVLIPRQDTECLVERVLPYVDGKRVLDVCTGSGCIAIAIAKLGKPFIVHGVDISEEALAVARQNATELNASVELFAGDLMTKMDGQYDVIVSNPPYIPPSVIEGLMPEVRLHEPMLALDGGQDGLEFYRRIAGQAVTRLAPNGRLFLEIGCEQAAAVAEMSQEAIAELEKNGKYALNLDGAEAVIEAADVEIFSEDIPGWLVANEGKLTVALEVTVTEELRREGIARELVNRIQNIRKSSGFEITDKIKITISKNTQTDDAVNEYNTYICNQVLGTSLDLADEVKDGTELNFDDFSLFVNVIKD